MASNLEVAGSPSRESKPVNLIPNTNLPPNHPDLDSKTIKQWYRQCQKCEPGRSQLTTFTPLMHRRLEAQSRRRKAHGLLKMQDRLVLREN